MLTPVSQDAMDLENFTQRYNDAASAQPWIRLTMKSSPL